MDRYDGLARAFVGLADTLVADFDVIELAQQLVDSAVELLPVDAAGIVLSDSDGNFQALASSSEQTHLLELFQVQQGSGPCLLAHLTGEPVIVEDLRTDNDRWPDFAARAVHYGFLSVQALPMRLRTERVGALNLLRVIAGPLSTSDIAIGQALADVATIGIVHQRIAMQSDVVNQQLQTALNTRAIIEQAKGVLAERGATDVDSAFNALRAYARSSNKRLADVARAVVDGADTTAILNRD
ncbi:GAF and ANTAR domain-containing protein [Mycolicibacterium fluoranthenivorans]|uniref:GAF domain-containing protein n=1 Tax=Mycolicibacterium fluoranthenivorans TaxID=258505 RepID=A0A1G4VJ10_9MYCO|nr:GAF and ANTAR domain-containing protein [Mycolicibacterium fluoranthenivorans]SCX07012.1 GAF domain-containing protein [Mycolicibacterium fluoranthenivorans]